MKNWRNNPHLFANGKFHFKTNELDEYWQEEGFFYDMDGVQFSEKGYQPDSTILGFDKCILIARPISDMSDDEFPKAMQLGYVYRDYMTVSGNHGTNSDNEMLETLAFMASENELPTKCFLYLLSIGVYPFDQNNPKDVIWRYENE